MSHEEDDAVMLDPAEAGEEIPEDEDAHMDSDADDDDETEPLQAQEELEIQLQNDSIAHCDSHAGNSIFCISQHPTRPNIVATGGGEDEEAKEVGLGFIFDVDQRGEISSNNGSGERESIRPLAALKGHTDSIVTMAFTKPNGAFLVTGGLDGRLIAHRDTSPAASPGTQWTHHAAAQEVEEINWLAACPHPDYPDTIALGASDGSIWVYSITAPAVDGSSYDEDALAIVQTYYIHTASCTAGSWTPDGNFLATVSEDGSLYVWDVWGAGVAAGVSASSKSASAPSAQAVVALTALDERFKVEGGLFSVAVGPGGAIVAVGGADGNVRVVGLPRVSTQPAQAGKSGKAGAKSKSQGQPGVILASLKAQGGSIETLDFSPLAAASAPGSAVTSGPSGAGGVLLLAAGSVDGSIVVFDAGHSFTVRKRIAAVSVQREEGEEGDIGGEGEAVVQVEFVRGGTSEGWLLTSAGYDGVLRRWDLRGGQSQTAGTQGLVGEWRGHRGGGEGGGIMGFVQGTGGGGKVVTAGDDGVALVFDTTSVPQAG